MQRLIAFIVSGLPVAGIALVLGTAAAGPASATPGQIYEISRPVVNLRAGPSTDTKVIDRLRKGARLMEFDRKEGWIKVREMGKLGPEGWVLGRLVAPEELPPPAGPFPEPQSSDAAPSSPDGGEGPGYGDDGGRVYYAYPRSRLPRRIDNRAFVPWGVTVHKEPRRKRRGGRHRGGRDKSHKDRKNTRDPGASAAREDQRAPRNLGHPRTSGAPNIGTMN